VDGEGRRENEDFTALGSNVPVAVNENAVTIYLRDVSSNLLDGQLGAGQMARDGGENRWTKLDNS
jgi:hypothetical protein